MNYNEFIKKLSSAATALLLNLMVVTFVTNISCPARLSLPGIASPSFTRVLLIPRSEPRKSVVQALVSRTPFLAFLYAAKSSSTAQSCAVNEEL